MDEIGPFGFYGMTVAGLPGAVDLMNPVRPGWPVLTVSHDSGNWSQVPDYEDDRVSVYSMESVEGTVSLDRGAVTAHFSTKEMFDDQAYVHPFLGSVGAVFTWWLGRDGFHAGAFVNGGRAWAVLGDRGAGKSSLIAHLHLDGIPVLADDLTVIDGGDVLPGPRCIDLRDGAAEYFGVGEDLGVLGSRRRHRLKVAAMSLPVPIAGWVLPTWGDTLSIRSVPPVERLPILMNNLALTEQPVDANRLLDFVALPFLEWTRPKEWSESSAAVAALLATTA